MSAAHCAQYLIAHLTRAPGRGRGQANGTARPGETGVHALQAEQTVFVPETGAHAWKAHETQIFQEQTRHAWLTNT